MTTTPFYFILDPSTQLPKETDKVNWLLWRASNPQTCFGFTVLDFAVIETTFTGLASNGEVGLFVTTIERVDAPTERIRSMNAKEAQRTHNEVIAMVMEAPPAVEPESTVVDNALVGVGNEAGT